MLLPAPDFKVEKNLYHHSSLLLLKINDHRYKRIITVRSNNIIETLRNNSTHYGKSNKENSSSLHTRGYGTWYSSELARLVHVECVLSSCYNCRLLFIIYRSELVSAIGECLVTLHKVLNA